MSSGPISGIIAAEEVQCVALTKAAFEEIMGGMERFKETISQRKEEVVANEAQAHHLKIIRKMQAELGIPIDIQEKFVIENLSDRDIMLRGNVAPRAHKRRGSFAEPGDRPGPELSIFEIDLLLDIPSQEAL